MFWRPLPLFFLGAGPASALTCQWVDDPLWMQQHGVTQGALIGLVQALETAVSGALTFTNQLAVSAVAVHTKQVDADAQRLSATRVATNQAMASTMMQQDRNLRVARVQEDYSIKHRAGRERLRHDRAHERGELHA